MAGELLSFGIQTLWNLLNQEYELFQGVEDQVSGLKRDLNLLSSFLKDADAKKHTSAVVKNCVEEIKEIICDGEDIIETFLLKQKLGEKSGVKKSIKRLACIIPDRRENALDIGGICIRISNVIQNMQSFNVKQIFEDDKYMQPLRDRQREMRQTFPKDYESDFVGLEANVKELVGYLVEENGFRIVSVTGMGGLGKTTLARQVFNHEDVKRKFDGLAWVCVSQDFTRMNVWQKIWGGLNPKEEEKNILEMEESTLHDKLLLLLETSKSLIVLDDIWKEEDWNLIKPIFPPEKDWKVLLTSRTDSVAVGSNTIYNFKPECLTPDDSWKLFQRIALPRNSLNKIPIQAPLLGWASFFLKVSTFLTMTRVATINKLDASEAEHNIDEEMKKMGKEMVEHCGGLPLAVKVLGGLLAAKYTLRDWKRVSENIGSQLVERTSSKTGSIDQVLSMSIEELPSYLKQCFLYLAHFPEDYKINREDLSYYWAADGIFKHRHYDGETIRDIGDSYIEELVQRNIIISGRDETCHLHDMMRDVCLFKAKEENFLQIGPSTSIFQSHGTSRRFVSHNADTLDVKRDVNNPKLRSLMVVPVKKIFFFGEGWKLQGSSFKRLELLRVLNLFNARFEGGKLPSSIGKLIHLRYLSLKGAEVYHLPASLGNLMLLIYLNLDTGSMITFIFTMLVPNVLMGMQELRYLALPMSMNEKTKLELSRLVKLETLKNFSAENSSIEDLRAMVRLRSLGIKLAKKTSIETVSALIGGLRNLEDLTINDGEYKRNQEEGILLNFIHLKHLRLSMYMPKLPKEQHFPSRLTTLSLRNCGLEEDPMPILEKLLQLKEVSLWYKSFSGKSMDCSGGGFPQLEKLEFSNLEEWEEWIVEKGSMPLLHTLSIRYCPKLKELPDGLRFITSLKELQIITDQREFTEKLSEGGEDYYKVQHIPLLNIN